MHPIKVSNDLTVVTKQLIMASLNTTVVTINLVKAANDSDVVVTNDAVTDVKGASCHD